MGQLSILGFIVSILMTVHVENNYRTHLHTLP